MNNLHKKGEKWCKYVGCHTCEANTPCKPGRKQLTLSQRTTANKRMEKAIRQINASKVYFSTGANTAPEAPSCFLAAMMISSPLHSQHHSPECAQTISAKTELTTPRVIAPFATLPRKNGRLWAQTLTPRSQASANLRHDTGLAAASVPKAKNNCK